jgi:cyclopropane fatty-acyl-phospholipid synthase-like methyltransferase
MRLTHLVVHDNRVFARAFAHRALGVGESYRDNDGEAVDLLDRQSGRRAYAAGQRRYDLDNDLMLVQRLDCSCGYRTSATDLDSAREAKLALICRKLYPWPGMHGLDIGCGWGGALTLAAGRYGVIGVGVTLNHPQAYARRPCRDLAVETRLQAYRTPDECLDAVFSIGLFDHVGARHDAGYVDVVRYCLVADGQSLLHTIGTHESPPRPGPWIERSIFPTRRYRHGPDRQGTGVPLRARGLAQLRRRLGNNRAPVAGQIQCRIAGAGATRWRTRPAHVAVLTRRIDGCLSDATRSPLAGHALTARHARRPSRAAPSRHCPLAAAGTHDTLSG